MYRYTFQSWINALPYNEISRVWAKWFFSRVEINNGKRVWFHNQKCCSSTAKALNCLSLPHATIQLVGWESSKSRISKTEKNKKLVLAIRVCLAWSGRLLDCRITTVSPRKGMRTHGWGRGTFPLSSSMDLGCPQPVMKSQLQSDLLWHWTGSYFFKKKKTVLWTVQS